MGSAPTPLRSATDARMHAFPANLPPNPNSLSSNPQRLSANPHNLLSNPLNLSANSRNRFSNPYNQSANPHFRLPVDPLDKARIIPSPAVQSLLNSTSVALQQLIDLTPIPVERPKAVPTFCSACGVSPVSEIVGRLDVKKWVGIDEHVPCGGGQSWETGDGICKDCYKLLRRKSRIVEKGHPEKPTKDEPKPCRHCQKVTHDHWIGKLSSHIWADIEIHLPPSDGPRPWSQFDPICKHCIGTLRAAQRKAKGKVAQRTRGAANRKKDWTTLAACMPVGPPLAEAFSLPVLGFRVSVRRQMSAILRANLELIRQDGSIDETAVVEWAVRAKVGGGPERKMAKVRLEDTFRWNIQAPAPSEQGGDAQGGDAEGGEAEGGEAEGGVAEPAAETPFLAHVKKASGEEKEKRDAVQSFKEAHARGDHGVERGITYYMYCMGTTNQCRWVLAFVGPVTAKLRM
jgi:hypothetical protein